MAVPTEAPVWDQAVFCPILSVNPMVLPTEAPVWESTFPSVNPMVLPTEAPEAPSGRPPTGPTEAPVGDSAVPSVTLMVFPTEAPGGAIRSAGYWANRYPPPVSGQRLQLPRNNAPFHQYLVAGTLRRQR
jgi:hypothetical protein